MKTGTNSLWTKSLQVGSFLLVLLFLSITSAPLLHHHEHSHTEGHVNTSLEESIQLADKCVVCDYYHHIAGQQILLSYPQIQTILNAHTNILDNPVLVCNYKFTLQGFTNKGPPCLIL